MLYKRIIKSCILNDYSYYGECLGHQEFLIKTGSKPEYQLDDVPIADPNITLRRPRLCCLPIRRFCNFTYLKIVYGDLVQGFDEGGKVISHEFIPYEVSYGRKKPDAIYPDSEWMPIDISEVPMNVIEHQPEYEFFSGPYHCTDAEWDWYEEKFGV